jgi:hypothetical protein
MAAASVTNGCEDQVDDRGRTPYAAVRGAIGPLPRATSQTQQQEDV